MARGYGGSRNTHWPRRGRHGQSWRSMQLQAQTYNRGGGNNVMYRLNNAYTDNNVYRYYRPQNMALSVQDARYRQRALRELHGIPPPGRRSAAEAAAQYNGGSLRARVQQYGNVATTQPPAAGGAARTTTVSVSQLQPMDTETRIQISGDSGNQRGYEDLLNRIRRSR